MSKTVAELEADNAALVVVVGQLRQIVYELTRNEIEMRVALEKSGDFQTLSPADYLIKYGTNDPPGEMAAALQLPDATKLMEIQDSVVAADDIVRGAAVNPPITLEEAAADVVQMRVDLAARLASH